jgi:hypothetical protein
MGRGGVGGEGQIRPSSARVKGKSNPNATPNRPRLSACEAVVHAVGRPIPAQNERAIQLQMNDPAEPKHNKINPSQCNDHSRDPFGGWGKPWEQFTKTPDNIFQLLPDRAIASHLGPHTAPH